MTRSPTTKFNWLFFGIEVEAAGFRVRCEGEDVARGEVLLQRARLTEVSQLRLLIGTRLRATVKLRNSNQWNLKLLRAAGAELSGVMFVPKAEVVA